MWFKTLIAFLFSFVVAACSAGPGERWKGHIPTSDPKIVMHGDVTFTKLQRETIEKAAATWKYQTDGLADLRIVWDYDPESVSSIEAHKDDATIRNLPETNDEVKAVDCEISESAGFHPGFCLPVVLAWVSPSGGIHAPSSVKPVTLKLIPDRYDGNMNYMFQVTLHEMGHIFGLPHSNASQAVMWPSSNPDNDKTCLRQDDLANFCKENVCEGHKMHPCEE